jgi:cyclic-di-AMP phosphodiesterase PgpH
MKAPTRNSLLRLPAGVSSLLRVRRLDAATAAGIGVAFAAALAVVILSAQMGGWVARVRLADWNAGRIAESDFIAERDFTYIDEAATERKREARKRTVAPVYRLNDAVSADALRRFDSFADTYRHAVREGGSAEMVRLRLQADFPGMFDAEFLRVLGQFGDSDRLFDRARGLLEDILSAGVIDLSSHRQEVLGAGAIEVWRTGDGTISAAEVPLDSLDTTESLSLKTREQAVSTVRSEAERRLIIPLVRAFAVENAFFDSRATAQHRDRAADAVEPVAERLAKGQVLVRKGGPISAQAAARIRALSVYTTAVNANGVVGSAVFLALLFGAALFLFAPRVTAAGPARRGQSFLLLGMGIAPLLITALLLRLVPLPDWLPASVVVPTSVFSILAAILVSPPAGISIALFSSLSLLLVTGMKTPVFIFAFLSGVAGTAVVLEAERRIDLIRAGLILSLLDALFLAVIGLLSNLETGRLLAAAGWGIANGFACGILALGFLPILEHALNAPTRFRLMELSDLNSPIFKRMLSLAPGTYTHSISVANLAETACEAIGANALLARVGAYYHDIGKIDQADFFIENQKAVNRHDQMKASLSVAVIKSHVRIGVEKARQLSLPTAIVDIIAQHHGRGLITYFYHRAMSEEKGGGVSRDDFSYPGIRPRSREAAVLMLADSVEAASRVIKKPTESRLDKLVRDAIMAKFSSGELGDSGLTLRDLETIRKSFVHILEGYFHTRIEYPKLKDRERRQPEERPRRRSAGGTG